MVLSEKNDWILSKQRCLYCKIKSVKCLHISVNKPQITQSGNYVLAPPCTDPVKTQWCNTLREVALACVCAFREKWRYLTPGGP